MKFGAVYKRFLDTSELHKEVSYILVIFENDDAMCILPHQTERVPPIAACDVIGLALQRDDYNAWYLGVCVSGEPLDGCEKWVL